MNAHSKRDRTLMTYQQGWRDGRTNDQRHLRERSHFPPTAFVRQFRKRGVNCVRDRATHSIQDANVARNSVRIRNPFWGSRPVARQFVATRHRRTAVGRPKRDCAIKRTHPTEHASSRLQTASARPPRQGLPARACVHGLRRAPARPMRHGAATPRRARTYSPRRAVS